MRARLVITETVTDGLRTVGSIVPCADDFEVFDGAGTYLFKAASKSEARAALRRHDVDARAGTAADEEAKRRWLLQ